MLQQSQAVASSRRQDRLALSNVDPPLRWIRVVAHDVRRWVPLQRGISRGVCGAFHPCLYVGRLGTAAIHLRKVLCSVRALPCDVLRLRVQPCSVLQLQAQRLSHVMYSRTRMSRLTSLNMPSVNEQLLE